MQILQTKMFVYSIWIERKNINLKLRTQVQFLISVLLKRQRCSRLRESQVTECSSDGVPTVPYHAYSMTKGTNQLTIGPLSDGLRKRQKNHTNTDTCQ